LSAAPKNVRLAVSAQKTLATNNNCSTVAGTVKRSRPVHASPPGSNEETEDGLIMQTILHRQPEAGLKQPGCSRR
jgi:hypothetical protein